ncbi:ABC transporter substrate-binding protein [Neobacillus sp. SAB-20_R2A]|uniref:ABC transporter substrate-binding protein n=1 Tax=Neobacillus sp. SAB-20_R2A TaxID=3120519 RepID=UPI003C6E8D6D
MRIRRNQFHIFLVIILVLLALTSCSNAEAPKAASKDSSQTTVVDYMGRSVEVPKKINRIACLYAYTGHVVTMLGEGKKIVAVNNGLKRDTLLGEINPAIKDALVPNTSDKINIEELANAAPDVIFIQESLAKNDGEVRKLEELKIPYLVVNFNSIKEQQQSIAMIGKAIGRSDRAEKFNEFYKEVITQVSAKVKDIPEKNRVRVYHSVMEATRTDTKDSLPAEWMKVAGAVNVSAGENLKIIENKYFANLEQILLWDSDVILVNEDGVADYILNSKPWQSLKAVKNKKVYQMPNGVSRWGHPGGLETPLAILWTAKTLYPDRFKDTDMTEVTAKFYKDFFDYNPAPEMIEKILSGKDMRTPK